MQALFEYAPDYKEAIQAGKDARHLWVTLKEWKGDNREKFFGELDLWATRRLAEMGVLVTD